MKFSINHQYDFTDLGRSKTVIIHVNPSNEYPGLSFTDDINFINVNPAYRYPRQRIRYINRLYARQERGQGMPIPSFDESLEAPKQNSDVSV